MITNHHLALVSYSVQNLSDISTNEHCSIFIHIAATDYMFD